MHRLETGSVSTIGGAHQTKRLVRQMTGGGLGWLFALRE